MNRPFPHSRFSSSPSFALISVLALVSLAALTATAFLASARLERQATMSLPAATRLDMAMHAAACGAAEMLDYAPSKHFNFVTTYWRGTNSTDWTNELGYLLSGAVQLTNSKTSTIYNYVACFSTATLTNLGTNPSALVVVTNTVSNQATFPTQIGTFMAKMTNFAPGQSTNIPLLGDSPANRYLSPPVGWVYINQDVRTKAGSTNTANIPVIRFAFYVQDLSSLIDATRMGSATNYRTSTNLPSNYVLGTNPAEISLTNATGTSLTNSSKFLNFVLDQNRAKYLTPGTLTLSTAGGLSNNDLRYVTTGLRHWTNAYARIPIGLGYGNSWDLKAVLSSNFISSASSASTIAFLITNNLTNFTSRAGAMNSNAYVTNIAANIVDYADINSTPTTDSVNNPTYLGIENIPWPNELFDSLQIKNYVNNTAPALPELRLQLKDFVEVWNMGNKTIPRGTTISIYNNYDMEIVLTNTLLKVTNGAPPPFFRINLKNTTEWDGTNRIANWTRYRDFTTLTNIPPNGYAVLEDTVPGQAHFILCATITNTNWVVGGKSPAQNPTNLAWCVYSPTNYRTTNMTYIARLGSGSTGQVIQASLGGRSIHQLAAADKKSMTNDFIFCNNIGFASQTGINGTPAHSGGDPRAQLFLSGTLYDQNYTNQYATPGGRNRTLYFLPGGKSPTKYPESEVNPATLWPDNGHIPNGTNSDVGGNPTNFTSPLTYNTNFGVTSPIVNNYVMVRNDSGGFTNIFELGNIYDPMQWSDSSTSVASQPGLWTNLTFAATPDSRFGGRNTLRIGRPEFTRFAFTNLPGAPFATPNMMTSAAALLDLFCTTNAQKYDESGLVNLNTAPAPVLRALAASVGWNKDPAQLPTTVRALPNGMAEAFAQGVMRFRAKYPFYSPSQLAFIGTDPTWPNTTNWPNNAVFGNTNKISLVTNSVNSLTNTSLGVTEWNDQAAEEWFSKIYGLSTTQSRNFRCYVIAQLVNSNKIPVGPLVRKYYDIVIRISTSKTNSTSVPPVDGSTFNIYEAPY